jgi:hypothetical protein
MTDLNLKRGEVNFVLMKHDADCPAKETQSMLDCRCEAEFEITSEAGWISAVKQTRAERRKAQREAEKVLRKARRT